MSQQHRTLFISDLHLDAAYPLITQKFISLFTRCDPTTTDAIYILGDLFEVWIGDDGQTDFHQPIVTTLKNTVQRGIPVYFLPGNRDFLIGKQFLNATGCQLLPDEAVIHLYGETILLMHGDTLCTLDIAYQKTRKLFHRPLIQTLFLWLPLSIRKTIAGRLRAKSHAYTQDTPLPIMDVVQADVEQTMQKHHATYLIHGHTHRPAFHHFSLEGKPALRIVLGAWHEKGSVLIWDRNGCKELADY